MTSLRTLLMLGILALFAACAAQPTKFRSYDGPEVTSLVLFKAQRQMLVMHDNTVLLAMSFELGFSPVGPKLYERDGRTPEGTYRINRRNPNSQFHLSLDLKGDHVGAAVLRVVREVAPDLLPAA